MINIKMFLRFKLLFSAMIIFIAFSASAQVAKPEIKKSNNSYGIPHDEWITYLKKSNLLLEKVDQQNFLNDVIFKDVRNFEDRKYFEEYVKNKIKNDLNELVYKIGTGKISKVEEVNVFLSSLKPKYSNYFTDFNYNRNEIIEKQNSLSNSLTRKSPYSPGRGPGDPCQNMDFESGNMSFWNLSWAPPDYISSYFLGIPIYSDNINYTTVVNAGVDPSQHSIVTGGTDIGGVPKVMPGGTKSFRLGDGPLGGGHAAFMNQTFRVLASNPYFTYNYAVFLQDGGAGHDNTNQARFEIRMKDGSGNFIDCASLNVNATSAASLGLLNDGSGTFYKDWTQVLIPLSAYIGQDVTIYFSTYDCLGGGGTYPDLIPGSHDAWAYIDCSCNPPQLLTSSPTVCGGQTVNLNAPNGLGSYLWTGPGIVGANNTANAVVNAGGVYTVTMTTMTTAPHVPCTFSLNITIGSNPAFPVANFTSIPVCLGATTQFTDASSGASIDSWSWDFNADGVSDAITPNPSHIFPSATTFPVTLTVTSGTCVADTTLNAIVNPITSPTLTPAGPFCITEASVNLVTSVAGGIWSGTGIVGGTNTTGAFDPAIATIGNNTISYNITGTCPSSASMVVQVNAIAIIGAGPDQTICNGNTVTLAGTIGGAATTGTWSGGAGTFNPNNTTATAVYTPTMAEAVAGSLTFTFTSNVAGACGAVSDQMVITINQLATINAGLDQTICMGSSAILAGVIGGAATSATWSGGAGTYTPNNTTLSASYLPSAAEISAGTATLTLTTNDPAAPCSFVNDQMILTINPIATINAGIDQTICMGSTVTLAGIIGGATTTGTWSGVAGSFNPNNTTATAIYTPTAAEAAAGGLTLTYTSDDPAGPCSLVSDQMVITINQPATANAGPAQTICAGTSATLAGSIGGAATSGTWGGGSGTYNPSNSNLSAVYTPSVTEEAAGSVTLTLISNDPAGPCPVASNTVTITINPIATINAGPDQTICIGSTVTLAGTIGGATNTGTWLGGAGSFNPNNTSATAIYTPTAAEEAANGLTLTFTSDDPAGPCGLVSDQMIITINQLPTANAGIDQTICAGTSATLAGIIGGTATSATWSGGTGTYTPDNLTLAASYLPSAAEVAAGTVTLTLTTNTPPGLCPPVNDQMIITINPIATINAGTDDTICIGSTVTLAGTIGGAATSGTWSGGAGSFNPNNSTANAVYTPTSAEEAANGLTLTYTSNDPTGPCGLVSDQMVITINQLPTINAGPSQSVCKGTSIQLSGTIGGSATSAAWSGGTGTYVPNNNSLTALYTPSAAEYAAGTVTLTLTTNDPAGPCPFVSAPVTFNFYFNPVINFGVDDPDGCPIHCVKFNDSSKVGGGDNISLWDWNFGDGSPDSTSQNPTHCYSLPGYYDVTLTATSNHGCSVTYSILHMIHVFDVPVAQFSPTPNPASILESTVTLVNQSSTDVNYWNWQFGDGDSISPNVVNPVHTYPNDAEGTYTATLIVHNNDGCADTTQQDIIIGPEFTFYIPNAFTPNGDGVNDFFFGTGIGIKIYDIYIFDRWGNMIYHGDNIYTSRWDGKANHGSDTAQQDVFVWKVKLTDVFGKKHNYIGTVTLIN